MLAQSKHSLAAALAALSAAMLNPLPAGAKTEPAYQIEQYHCALGTEHIVTTDHGIKFHHGLNENTTYTVQAQAPDWTAVIYRTDAKLIYRSPYKTWRKYGFNISDTIPIDIPSMSAENHQPCQRFGLPCQSLNWNGKSYRFHGLSDIGAKEDLAPYSYVVSNAKELPAQAAELLQLVYGLPVTPGFPLEFVCKEPNNRVSFLKTDKCIKSTVDEHTFDVPKGLSPTTNSNIIFIPASVRDGLNSIAQ